ncbi:MAG: hypothetical protein DI538_06400 [Azospira oryzae]|nr:MAG: hypothetical protein DI538_06400 [Azospira oryzae]
MVLKTKLVLLIVVVCTGLPCNKSFAQNKAKNGLNVFLHPDKFYRKFFPHLKISRNPPDSMYIRSYQHRLSIGAHVLSPVILVDINSRKSATNGIDPSLKLRTNLSDVIGFSASYRFVAVGFAYLLKTRWNTRDDYAASRYRTATIKYNSGANAFQFKYVRIKGFTDVNRFNRTNALTPYMPRPDIVSKEFQFENIYNFSWKKYSYLAPLTFTQRQIKSHAGFLIKAGVYYHQLSSDTTIISQRQQEYYDDFSDVKVIRSLSLRVAPGIGGNLVFYKQIYLSMAVFTSFDFYNYKYLQTVDEKVRGRQTAVFFLDGKSSLGYQSRRMYAGVRYEAERRVGSLSSIQTKILYRYLGIEMGYRFTAPKAIKKFYKKTMPPGM